MRKLRMVCLTVLAAILIVGCNGNSDSQENTEVVKNQELPEGFKGGCTGNKQITLYVQNQFTPYGAKGLYDIDDRDQGGPALYSDGSRYKATGWFDTGKSVYPNNPDRIRGEVWYYVPSIDAWLADAGVRRKANIKSAPNDDSNEFTPDQAVPRPKECELTR